MTTFVCEDTGKACALSNQVWVEEPSKQSTKVNALWKQQPGLSTRSPGAQFYQLKLESGDQSVWFGMVPEEKFGAGWKCKGFMYGGNTSDGGALMRQNFGPRPKAGDVIGMRSELVLNQSNKSYTLEIFYSLNDVPLGQAFKVEGINETTFGPLYPCVSFNSGPSKATITRSSVPPKETFEKQIGGPRTSMAGEWKAPASAFLANSENLPDVEFEINMNDFGLQAKVDNRIMVGFSPDPPHGSTGRVISTRMLPLPEHQPLEQRISELLSSFEELVFSGGNVNIKEKGSVFTLVPNEKILEPVSRKEIHWIEEE